MCFIWFGNGERRKGEQTMSKGLEKLESIKRSFIFNVDKLVYNANKNHFKTIEKELKALEIIKKYVGIQESYDEIFPYDIVDKQYVSTSSGLIISKEEYNLLKEVLS